MPPINRLTILEVKVLGYCGPNADDSRTGVSMQAICSKNRFRRPEKRVLGLTSVKKAWRRPNAVFLEIQSALGPRPTPVSHASRAFFVMGTACFTRFFPQTACIDSGAF